MKATVSAAVSGRATELVILLYSASLSMSAFYQNNLLLRKACNSSAPFGECAGGEARAQHVVSVIYSWKAIIQYAVPVVSVLLAGEDRRRFFFFFGRKIVDNRQLITLIIIITLARVSRSAKGNV